MQNLLDQLNIQQRAAVEQAEGPLLILAGAGSGKTRVITYRIAHLIEVKGVPPQSILAVTFTNKAAAQMKERVAKLLSGGVEMHAGGPHVSTFHSFCVSVLRRHIDHLGYSRDFSIYDADDQARLMKSCIQELGLGEQVTSPRSVLAKISYAKNHGMTAQMMYEQAHTDPMEKIASLFDLYEKKLRQANALDFDDLLLKTVQLFYKAGEVCEQYNRRFQYVLVDEYQDTNRTQYQLIRQLSLIHQNLCVVGDEDQSIYRWRGADIQNILSFEKDYPNARTVRLEQNYRSTQKILDAAGAVVSRNQARKGKTLWTDRKGGDGIGLYEAWDADQEALYVADEITKALAQDANASVAVLYRTNAQSRVLEESLRRNRIAYRLVGGFSFYARAEIRDVLAYARLAINPKDVMALQRIINTPARGIGGSTLGAIESTARAEKLTLWEALEHEIAARRLPARAVKALEAFHALMKQLMDDQGKLLMGQFFKSVLDRTGYVELLKQENQPEAQDRIENLQELVNAAVEAEEQGITLAEFLDHAALVSDSDDFDERARVTLMTLTRLLLPVAALAVALAATACLPPRATSSADPAGVESLVNASRADNGLPALADDVQLDVLAQNWAVQLAAAGHLAHQDLAAIDQFAVHGRVGAPDGERVPGRGWFHERPRRQRVDGVVGTPRQHPRPRREPGRRGRRSRRGGQHVRGRRLRAPVAAPTGIRTGGWDAPRSTPPARRGGPSSGGPPRQLPARSVPGLLPSFDGHAFEHPLRAPA